MGLFFVVFAIFFYRTSHEAFYVSVSVQASLIALVRHNGRHFMNISIVVLSLYFTDIVFFSWATRQGFPVLSVPINSQTQFPGAYRPLQGPRVWALDCMAVWLTLIPRRVVEWWGNISQFTNLAQLNLRLQRDVKYECNNTAVCHRVFPEWVKGLEGFQESI